MRAAVVGHVEWIDFVRVGRVPTAGEIIHALDWWEEPGGGGSVSAVQLARLAGSCLFLTALGDDDLGRRSRRELTALGVTVAAAQRRERQRRGVTFLDAGGERTITVLGERLAPVAGDDLPWAELERADAVYLTGGDPDVIRRARSARVLVATARVLPALAEAGVQLDALVGSAADPAERYAPGGLDPPPRLVVRTEGAAGGTYRVGDGAERRYAPAPLDGPIVDTYGAGDSFAAGLTYALGAGESPSDAIGLAARCGAAVLTGRGPYERQLRLPPVP